MNMNPEAPRVHYAVTVKDGLVLLITTLPLPESKPRTRTIGSVGHAPGNQWAAHTAKGATIGRGYYTRREATKAVLIRGGFRPERAREILDGNG